MQIRALKIEGAFEITPRQFHDDRGLFLESFRGDKLADAIGHRLDIIQTNVSVSSRGTVRGVHFADVPPSQAKYVTALSGSFLDFVIDIRVGSPTFGQWDSVLLDTVDRRAIYLAEGLGHAICCLQDDSTVMYRRQPPRPRAQPRLARGRYPYAVRQGRRRPLAERGCRTRTTAAVW
jgi:dTDP-4-dehydrorhamnose 3,5-epimerase